MNPTTDPYLNSMVPTAPYKPEYTRGSLKVPDAAPNTSTYWVGQDGNIWFSGPNGVQNMGKPIEQAGTDWAKGFDAMGGSGQATQIADPNPGNPSGTTNTAETNNATSNLVGGSGTQYPDLSGAIALLRQNIGSLDPIYQAQVSNAIKSYDTSNNERMSAFGKAKAESDNSDISNDQNVLQSRNAINQNARMSSRDIMSILGSLGMGGSTTTKALRAIADKSNKDMNSSNYEYGKNKQNILQSWNDFSNADTNQQKQLNDTREYNIAQAGIARDTGKMNFLQQIAGNQIEMGNNNTAPIQNEITGLNNNIATLTGVNKSYTGATPTYAAPAISTLLGQNMAKFDVAAGTGKTKSAPKLIKVNEQSGSGDSYGIK